MQAVHDQARLYSLLAAMQTAVFPAAWLAQTLPAAAAPGAETITVIGASPLLGSGIDRDKVPADTTVLDGPEIDRDGTPNLSDALNAQVAGITLGSASGNPYQPSLFYDGFEASPLQGTPQGLAVYLNGIRFNQPFGDTVNWDLIPDDAIEQVSLEGSNPVFGLNALGGSINVRLKNGFTSPGAEIELSGGSFGQVQTALQYGVQSGNVSAYVAANEEHQDGWRDLQSSDIQNLYADLDWRGDALELHASLNLANSVLNGPGTSPVQLLAADPAAQFTAPNSIANKFAQLAVSANRELDVTTSLQGVAYYDDFQQRVVNGNAPNDVPCNDGSGLLCSSPGVLSTTRGGAAISDFLSGGPYSELDSQTTNTNGYGASAQLTNNATLFGLGNHFVAGVSFDGAQTEFSADGAIGGLTPVSRVFTGSAVTIDEPGIDVPVRVAVSDATTGMFASDTLDLTGRVSMTASGRFNNAQIDLFDQGGGTLTGDHRYDRLNPAIGATYRVTSWLTAYAGYAEANRAPTPAELSCAGPADSCSLANFFVGDPDLKQVVAHTVEAGVRGGFEPFAAYRLGYDVGLFHTDSDDDIMFVNSAVLGRAFFTNIGQTRRMGLNGRLTLKGSRLSATLNYSYTQATFQTGFVEAAGSNPGADANGDITILPGDRLPGIPQSKITAGLDYRCTDRWSVGGSAIIQSGQYLFGDQANLQARLPHFFTLDLRTSYRITPHLQVFGNIQNASGSRFYTYGTFSPTGSVFLAQAPNATDPRSYSPARRSAASEA